MTDAKMIFQERIVVKCLDAGDGTGDSIIDLPDRVLEAIGAKIGDPLSIEKIGDVIFLRPVCTETSAK